MEMPGDIELLRTARVDDRLRVRDIIGEDDRPTAIHRPQLRSVVTGGGHRIVQPHLLIAMGTYSHILPRVGRAGRQPNPGRGFRGCFVSKP
jgi:hypothetical protein